jgi:hypothetical protein
MLAREARLCPHCKRVVLKVDGCDAMTCGKDAPDKGGGNVQHGCGQRFNWGQAERYAADVGVGHLGADIGELQAAAPAEEERVAPALRRPHPFFKCDVCRGQIRGPRFECLHCPCFSACAECDVSGRLREYVGGDGAAEHDAETHLLRIVQPPPGGEDQDQGVGDDEFEGMW